MKIIQSNRPLILMYLIKFLMRGIKKKRMLRHLQNF